MISHHIKHSKNEIIVRMISLKILKKISEDMKLLNLFLANYQGLITEKHEFSFHINEIYEQVLFIGKNLDKLKQISTQLQWDYEVEVYKFDK